MKSLEPYSIHWFRRDLRVEGSPALIQSTRELSGRVLGVFFFDPAFLSRQDFSHDRFAFFLRSLEALRQELHARGGDLLVLGDGPDLGWEKLLAELQTLGRLPQWVSWHRDYEPFARERDGRIERMLVDAGIRVRTARDHLVFEPHQILKDNHTPYQVFTPYSKRWMARLEEQGLRLPESLHSQPEFRFSWSQVLSENARREQFRDRSADFERENAPHVRVPLPEAGHRAALQSLDRFKKKLDRYEVLRDLPAESGTSQLSIYFKNGSLTVAQVIQELGLGAASTGSRRKFLMELIWREFYYSILSHFPSVEHEEFQTSYRAMTWQNDARLFEAWKEGLTGYPIVDAGMRQLRATGWMHNRVRMIVASFLTKDLLIDWRWGERYFMERLLDGDLAPNNGGWQWAASTGVDALPYFRIFNPELQSKRFDPQGEYIARWVPELASLSPRARHRPTPLERQQMGYPTEVVDHAAQKMRALTLFKDASSRSDSSK